MIFILWLKLQYNCGIVIVAIKLWQIDIHLTNELIKWQKGSETLTKYLVEI